MHTPDTQQTPHIQLRAQAAMHKLPGCRACFWIPRSSQRLQILGIESCSCPNLLSSPSGHSGVPAAASALCRFTRFCYSPIRGSTSSMIHMFGSKNCSNDIGDASGLIYVCQNSVCPNAANCSGVLGRGVLQQRLHRAANFSPATSNSAWLQSEPGYTPSEPSAFTAAIFLPTEARS